ncbi:type IV toxin-antitoxin system AbiEi family antitoxin domain-containing protein [Streptomyces xanthochromogenes]|uniref:type IV toxin-antitoxin system AbiEi family antitoxin domain-containing protein n=1 Tax=Streptomyces xanthochromogenes TaxID=67384 RepID=UPI00341F3D5B
MERSEAIRTVSAIAADQWGLITTAQAEEAGVSRVDLTRLADADLLERAARGVYQLPGAVPPHLDIKVAWLRLDPARPAWERHAGDGKNSGVISHTSACQLYDLGDIPSDRVEISVPRRRTTREPGITFRRAAVPEQDITIADGLPVTTVDRTICDLLHVRTDAGHVGRVLADADQKGLTDTRLLAPRVQPYTRSYGLPDDATGADLLESLAQQAGFVLRDQQMTTAGERAVHATALHPELLLEQLLHTSRQLEETAASLAGTSAPAITVLQQLAATQLTDSALGESLRQLVAQYRMPLPQVPDPAGMQQMLMALRHYTDHSKATYAALQQVSQPALVQAQQALRQLMLHQPYSAPTALNAALPARPGPAPGGELLVRNESGEERGENDQTSPDT